MTTASAHAQRSTIVHSHLRGLEFARRGIVNGLIASIAMAMVMMVLGAFDRGIFAAPSAIWAFFAGPDAYAPHTLTLGFLIGAMGHMMNSAVLGVVFAVVASRVIDLRGRVPSAAVGTIFALAVMVVMWNVVLPLGPNGAIVMESAALWIWTLGHVAYGMVAGLLNSRST